MLCLKPAQSADTFLLSAYRILIQLFHQIKRQNYFQLLHQLFQRQLYGPSSLLVAFVLQLGHWLIPLPLSQALLLQALSCLRQSCAT